MLPDDAAADVDACCLLVGGVGNSRATGHWLWGRAAPVGGVVGGEDGGGAGADGLMFSLFGPSFFFLFLLLLWLVVFLAAVAHSCSCCCCCCCFLLFLEEEALAAAADDDDDDEDEVASCTCCCCCCSCWCRCSTRFCKSRTCERRPSFDHSSSSFWGKPLSTSFVGTAWGPIMVGINSNVSSNDNIASSNLGDGGWVSREEFESSLTKCLGTRGVLSELV